MLMNATTRGRHLARLILIVAAIAALPLSMAACSASALASLTSTTAAAQARRLAMGTLRLEGTPQAVDAEAAAQLLPLWQLMDELSKNSAAAPQEISAVVDQIRTTMSAEQVGAIDEMSFSTGDATSAAADASSSSSASADTARVPMEAVVGGGMPPDGGGGIPGGGGGMPAGLQGQNSGSSSGSTKATTSSSVFRQVVSLLQSKLQSAPAS